MEVAMQQLIKSNPRILLVGAGAVGQAYGYHLRRGGAEVTFLVKEKYRAEAEAGFLLHRHRPFRRPKTFYFDDFDVISDPEDAGKNRWDQVWLCIPSTALDGPWLGELCGRIGQATLVSLQPGVEDLERIARVYEPAKIVIGLITLIAYQAPLAGESLRPGVAYLLPPMAPIPFGPLPSSPALGHEPPASPDISSYRALRAAEALNRGGCPARVDLKTPQLAAFGTAAFVPTIAGLEVARWSLARLRKSPALEIATAAAKEAQSVLSLHQATPIPLALSIARRPELLGTALSLAPRLTPFDLETYLEYHFTKVGQQTRQIVDSYIRLGEEHEFGTRALRVLRRLLAGDAS
jgi:2-dehydropantoate 2-reductase